VFYGYFSRKKKKKKISLNCTRSCVNLRVVNNPFADILVAIKTDTQMENVINDLAKLFNEAKQ